MNQNQYPPGYPPPGQFPQQQQPQFQQPNFNPAQGYPPGYPQFQQQPQYQQQMPPQGYQVPPGFAPTHAPGPSGMGAPPPPTSPGGFFIPPDQVIQQAANQTAEMKKKVMQARAGGFSKMKFFSILGPNGQPWKSAFVSYVGGKAIYIMPAWKEGVMNYVERFTRFWKSAQFPGGTSLNDTGSGDSLISKAYQMALDQGVKSPWCRLQKKMVYQGFPYEWDPTTSQLTHLDPAQCLQEDGTLRPMIFEAGPDLHTMIQDIAHTRKFVQTFHPDHGRPIAIKKTKTGPEAINVEWSAIDLDPQPLADCFRPGLNYLYALDELFKPASIEEQAAAIIDAKLPVPPEMGGFQGQAQTGYQPAPQQQIAPQNWAGPVSYQQGPQAPAPNPYQQQAPQNWPPQQGMAPQQQQFMQPPQPKPLPPPPPGAQGAAGTPMMPPQYYQQQPAPQQAPQMAPPPGYGQQPQQAPQQQPQQPMTPEQMQAMFNGGGDVPF